MFKRFHRLYFALFKSILYRFNTADDCKAFFTQDGLASKARGAIDLDDVVGVRVSPRRDLENPGIELVGLKRKWLVCPEGRESFVRWLQVLGDAVGRRNKRLYDENSFVGSIEILFL